MAAMLEGNLAPALKRPNGEKSGKNLWPISGRKSRI